MALFSVFASGTAPAVIVWRNELLARVRDVAAPLPVEALTVSWHRNEVVVRVLELAAAPASGAELPFHWTAFSCVMMS